MSRLVGLLLLFTTLSLSAQNPTPENNDIPIQLIDFSIEAANLSIDIRDYRHEYFTHGISLAVGGFPTFNDRQPEGEYTPFGFGAEIGYLVRFSTGDGDLHATLEISARVLGADAIETANDIQNYSGIMLWGPVTIYPTITASGGFTDFDFGGGFSYSPITNSFYPVFVWGFNFLTL
jgi:hypothetical protein